MNKSSYQSQKLTRVADNLYRNGEDVYFARIFKNGRQHKKSLGTHDRKTADRKLAEFEKQIERLNAETPDLPFEELVKKWLESIKHALKQSTYDLKVKHLKTAASYFKGKKLRALSRDDFMRWATARSITVGPRTFNLERETLSMLFRFAQDELGLLEKNPLDAIKKRKVIKAVVVPPTQEQFNKLVAHLEQFDKRRLDALNLILFLAYSGCRIEEARQVQWKHVNFEKGTVIITGGIRGTKNMKQRAVPLFPPLRAHLLKLSNSQPMPDDAFLFGHFSSKSALKTASRAIGIPKGEHFTHHDMRHFFCSNAIEKNIPDHVIAAWLGHSDGGILVKTTYGHLRQGFSDDMAKLMDYTAGN